MERQTGYEKGIYHQKTVNAKMALISGQFNLRHVIAGLAQRRDQTRQVRRIACLALDIGNETLGRQIGEDALVIDFKHVDILFGNDAEHVHQCSRPILQPDADARQTTRADLIPQQHIGQQARINIAASQDNADVPRTSTG